MGEGFQFIDIILFAMIAAFLILRLRSALGRHKEDGLPRQDPFTPDNRPGQSPDQRPQASEENIIPLPGQADSFVKPEDGAAAEAETVPETPLDAELNKIQSVSPDFDRQEFMVGARTAFEMIVQAFAEGNANLLDSLLSDEVYSNFLQAIRSREANNQTLENTLVRIVSADMIEAYIDNHKAFITVKIVSEQVNITRDEEGEIVDGDGAHITEITDIWTFCRDIKSRDPNWELVATRSLD
ncbi:MAG: Tim44/TimA family putative adaptor protein [Rhodospirillales bacterium]|jgi:predicted lipid-binding transport protein (Tim44 family)|nr:Tim44/TimA family putative adaptor protein [Rhodospirillales bacterium]